MNIIQSAPPDPPHCGLPSSHNLEYPGPMRTTTALDVDAQMSPVTSTAHGKEKRKEMDELDEHGTGASVKRTRTSNGLKENDHGDPHRHTIFWLPDGDTNLRIDNVLYRLNSSRLIDHSGYFEQLLTGMDTTERTSESGEIIHQITNTSSEDFNALLTMDRRPLDFGYKPPSFSEAAAVLRAATALDFRWYTKLIIRYLEKQWSPLLDDFISHSDKIPYAAETVVLSRRCNVPGVLKRAFYELIRGNYDEGALKILDREDERRVFEVRENLMRVWYSATVRKPRSCTKCAPVTRMSSLWHADSEVGGTSTFGESMFDPIRGLRMFGHLDWAGEGWCAKCHRKLKDKYTKMGVDMWESLDGLLALP